MSCCLPLTDGTLLPFVDVADAHQPPVARWPPVGTAEPDGGALSADRIGGRRPDVVDGYSSIETT
ncbi:hypothetical protein NJ7G_3886 [Natrinema sp. J7-2]|uniref:Uncharacterized protein n=1 Tax=Natrinema gari JCM 14663 TaxID=1230459 RepID=L9YTK5_9EURY|nr:hypothetical protein NJ7G_3886 [Natrinema sp. J7-2]ELY77510.1 hypothetical protein C486_15439 [Natrinema gari JCM 14663]